ncbi:MAG: hypothetical protein WBA42_18990 [Mesorhizobium sp.]
MIGINLFRSSLSDRRLWPKTPLDDELADLGVQLRDLGLTARLCILTSVVKRLGQVLDGLPFPLPDLVQVKLVLRRQFRDRPLSADRFKRELGLELGVKPPACLRAGSSFPAEDPSYASVLTNRHHLWRIPSWNRP